MDARTLLGGSCCVGAPAVLANTVAVGVTSLAIAGAAYPADLAEVVAADVTTVGHRRCG